MDAVVIAGGRPKPGDLLYEETQGNYKALLNIAGKPMIQWVLDALNGSSQVDQIVLTGLPADCGATSAKPITFLPDHGGLYENIRAGAVKLLELKPQTDRFVLASSDIPGITSKMVDWVAKTALETDDDVYYCVIERRVMEARYPGSRRSYLKLRDLELTGGDLNVLRASLIYTHEDIWKGLIATRKNVLKQASIIGFDVLLLAFFHLIDLNTAVNMVAKHLGIKARALICPYPEVGMDVDKPFQYELMRSDMNHMAVA